MKYIIALGGESLINPDGEHDDLLGDWNPLGTLVKVDDQDYDLASEAWMLFRGTVVARSKARDARGKRFLLQLHRVIAMRMWKGEEAFSHLHIVKFKNEDRLDMRRENLLIMKRGWQERTLTDLQKEAQEVMKKINENKTGK